jgi:hypothetical protein
MLKKNLLFLRSNSFLIWIIFFLVSNLVYRGWGGTNELARYATLRAMSQDQTFSINPYAFWTIDWSKTPAGVYYSNKAPGPMLLSFPFFAVFDRLFADEKKDVVKEILLANGTKKTGKVSPPTETTRTLMIFFFQLLPMALLSGLIALKMKSMGISSGAVNFFLLALLFGNSAAVFANVFMGHSMTAVIVLALFYSLWRKNYFQIGLFFGLALLNEYTAAILLPFILFYCFNHFRDDFKNFFNFLAGGIFPGVLWIWYHTSTMGNPFKTVLHYVNPAFTGGEALKKEDLILGMFSLNINWKVIIELLVGSSRGVLFTQPWIYIVLLTFILKRNYSVPMIPDLKRLFLFVVSSTLLMILLNSSFNGWHGGFSAGPRYLAFLFPMWAMLAAFIFDQIPQWQKFLWWFLLIPSLILRALIAGSTELAHDGFPLWPFLWKYMSNHNLWGEIRFMTFLSLFLIIGFYVWNSKSNFIQWRRDEN